MKIQYGDKFKMIPKKFGNIKDIGKYFMSDKLRLTTEERKLLDGILNWGIYSIVLKEWEKGISKSVLEYIDHSPIRSISKVVRRNEPAYYSVIHENCVEVRCEEILYKKAIKTDGIIKTSEIKRSY